MGGEEPPPSEETPWVRSPEDEEAEPDWAEQIRTSRKDRGEKLREVYSRFAEESTPLDDKGDEGDAE